MWCKILVDEYDAVRGDVHGGHPHLPIIGLTNINRGPMALDRDRFAILSLPSLTPLSGCPQFVASRTYQVRGIRVQLGDVVFGVPPLVQLCIIFLSGLPTSEYWPICRNIDRVAREVSGISSGIVVVYCLLIRLTVCEDLLVVWGSARSFCWA